MSSDPEADRLKAAYTAAHAAYGEGLDAYRAYLIARRDRIRREAKADPVVLALVNEATLYTLNVRYGAELTSAALAHRLRRAFPHLPEAKTLENVYLPALRDNFPHVTKHGNRWLWYWGAANASRDARAPHNP